jgi:hypothetical protein
MLGIFERITDYSKMMMRIMVSTFALSVLAFWVLRARIPELDATLAAHLPTVTIKIFDLPIPLGTLLPAAMISVLFRVFRVHDRISDVLGIRQRFDAKHILHPLAVGALGHVSDTEMKRIEDARHDLMSRVFYRYASSKSPKIDAHFVEDALDWWGWYWCVLEGICVAVISAGLAGLYGNWQLSAAFAVAALIGVIGAAVIKRRCNLCAHREVVEILRDKTRCGEIESQFRAIQGR